MEHARKFTLVPMDRMQRFHEEHLSELDTQIQTILKMKMDDHEKAKLYIQLLQKYVVFPDVSMVNPITENQSSALPSENKVTIETKVLDSVPVKHRKTALNILKFLKQHNFSWTDKREVTLNGQLLAGSDILQLMNFLLRNRISKPPVFDQFLEELKTRDFPQDFIKNGYVTGVKMLYARPIKNEKTTPKKWLTL